MTPAALHRHLAACAWPPGVVWAVSAAQGDARDLFPQERAAIANAVPKRVGEFAGGRKAARGALEKLGHARAAIPRGADRAPIWPVGVTGSISHACGLCLAAVAPFGRCDALGVDLEGDDPLPSELVAQICRPEERGGPDETHRAKRIFSAKEAIYKACYPSLRRVLGFEALRVDLDRRVARFTPEAGLASDAGDIGFLQWALPGLIVTVCVETVSP